MHWQRILVNLGICKIVEIEKREMFFQNAICILSFFFPLEYRLLRNSNLIKTAVQFFLRQLNSLEKRSSRLFCRKIQDDTTLPFAARHIVSRLLSSYVLRQRYVGAAFVYPDFKPCLQFQLRWSAITFVPDRVPLIRFFHSRVKDTGAAWCQLKLSHRYRFSYFHEVLINCLYVISNDKMSKIEYLAYY